MKGLDSPIKAPAVKPNMAFNLKKEEERE